MPVEFVVSKAVVTGGAQGLGAAVARRLAGEGMTVSLLDIKADRAKDDDCDQVIAVNLTGVCVGLRAAAPWLRTDAPGRVVLISSMVANTGNRGQMNYTAAKAGLVGLVRTGALELAASGPRSTAFDLGSSRPQ